MSEGAGPGPTGARPAKLARRRWIPFWVMQAFEIAVAVVFVDLSVHVNHGGLMVVAALAFFALAVTAQGPLGVFRVCNQRLHLLLAMVLAGVVAVAPVIPALRPDIEGIIVIEFGAVGMIRLATLTVTTEYPRATRGAVRRPGATVIDTTATIVDAARRGAADPTGARPPAPGKSTPTPGSARDGTARWVGRTTGAAAASGKKMAAKYGPEAEAQVKRTIRGAGRLAGRVTSSPEPPDDPAG